MNCISRDAEHEKKGNMVQMVL
uniref:Uncharacterized protein n=1 Tax=Arundo donax TaxID=35708 RepID=A0A0A9B3B5_ARUDO